MVSNSGTRDKPSIEEIARWLAIFVGPDQVTELRAIRAKPSYGNRKATISGFFDGQHLDKMAAEAANLSGKAEGVYFVPNPLNDAILARCANRVDQADGRELTADSHVIARKWIVVDLDPIRLAGVSSSDSEKQAALELSRKVYTELVAEGYPEPVVADSGNGYHLLFPLIDLAPRDVDLAKAFLHKIADRFDTDQVKIDRTVFNAARITKLYGTMACKGDSIPTRPHRYSRVLKIPEGLTAEVAE
jgi:hypothetical protein